MSPAPANVSVTCHQRRARPARIVSAAIGALAVAALAAGCQVAGAQSASPGGTVTLTVAATPGIDDAPLYLAVKNGLFKSAGLDVRIHSYQSVRQELQALTNGQADVAAGDYADFFYAQATSRADLRVVADGYHAAPGVMEVVTLLELGHHDAAGSRGQDHRHDRAPADAGAAGAEGRAVQPRDRRHPVGPG